MKNVKFFVVSNWNKHKKIYKIVCISISLLLLLIPVLLGRNNTNETFVSAQEFISLVNNKDIINASILPTQAVIGETKDGKKTKAFFVLPTDSINITKALVKNNIKFNFL